MAWNTMKLEYIFVAWGYAGNCTLGHQHNQKILNPSTPVALVSLSVIERAKVTLHSNSNFFTTFTLNLLSAFDSVLSNNNYFSQLQNGLQPASLHLSMILTS